MLSTHLIRHQLSSLICCNNANFSMDYHVSAYKRPIVKHNKCTAILRNKQQFRSFCLSRPIQNASGNYSSESYINLDHLWGAKPATTMGQNDERNKPKSGDWWTKQKEKEDKEIDAKSETIQKQLARKSIRYGQRQQKWLCIEYKMGRSGQKFLDLNKNGTGISSHDFSNIRVPEDVFASVRAMDKVLNVVEANRDKIESEAKTNHQNQQEFVLHTATAKGSRYDLELDLCLGQSLFVQMRKVPNERRPRYRPRFLPVPFPIFCWLRRAIGEVFVENGEQNVQQQLGVPPILSDKVMRLFFNNG